jgi:hypothetical protein
MQCPTCKAANADGVKFCAACGKPFHDDEAEIARLVDWICDDYVAWADESIRETPKTMTRVRDIARGIHAKWLEDPKSDARWLVEHHDQDDIDNELRGELDPDDLAAVFAGRGSDVRAAHAAAETRKAALERDEKDRELDAEIEAKESAAAQSSRILVAVVIGTIVLIASIVALDILRDKHESKHERHDTKEHTRH